MNIRKASINDFEGIAQVHVDCFQSAYADLLPSETLTKFTYENRAKRWNKDLPNALTGGTMTFVAEDKDGEIVGFALGGTMRDARLRLGYIGEVYGIYVHPNAQGQGLGKKLLESVAQHLVTNKLQTMGLWTFHEHPSCRFFESLGGKQIYNKKTTIAGKELEEVAYGWDNLQSFLVDKGKLN
ncbi:MAG: GNAT family N-acetyltransferase [Bacillus sp. (in: Bacteria)]|nr:GNAT family N-acetyltransferase [Bacillus sp. (in: firmicutes)]